MRMARNYSFLRVDVPFGSNDFELIAITNLRDGSSIMRASFTRRLMANISAYVIDTEFLGGRSTEFAFIQVRRVATFGARVYF